MGTDGWRNWKAFEASEPEIENVDDILFSDRQFTGGPTSLGPYTLAPIIRPDHGSAPSTVGPAIRLRLGIHANLIPEILIEGQLARPQSDAYHGGNSSDEIAALTSLSLGVRLRVAGTAQLSGIHQPGEHRQPIYLDVPPLAHPGRPGREHIPATSTREPCLNQLDRLKSFPHIDEKAQVELVRAARAYATGLWWANEDPNQAWLHLVTAAEVAANHRQRIRAEPLDLVKNLWPELWTAIEPAPNTVRNNVATLLATQMRATQKFIDFVVDCAPPPPEPRPEFEALDWGNLRKHVRLVYKYRSLALHSGKPFPLPMLEEPRRDKHNAVQEVPLGLNAGGLGGIWEAAETPMLLSAFEHIVRGALLTWWDEIIPTVATE